MQVRMNILNERFRLRVIRLTPTGNSFLGVTFGYLKIQRDLRLLLDANKLARSNYIAEANSKDLEKIRNKENSLSVIWDMDPNILRKNLCSNRLDIVTRRSLVLYLLKKHPHQGNCCLKDKSSLTALHLVQCNLGNWQACSLRIQSVFKGPRNNQKKLKFTEVPIDGCYIPKLISLGMEEQCNARAKKILLIIANSIKTSVRKCLSGTY
jgi:hypothetical protein